MPENGVVEVLGEDGVLRRSSSGRAGLEADLQFFRGLLRQAEASPGQEDQVAAMAGIVAGLEGLEREASFGTMALSAQETGSMCGANYQLTANVYPGMAYGSGTAESYVTEFGPPSWAKVLTTFVNAWSPVSPQLDSDSGTFNVIGGSLTVRSEAVTGPSFCQNLIARAGIQSPDCPQGGMYRSKTASSITCN